MADKAKDALELRLDAGASPERVAAAARLLARMLKAVAPTLPEDSVTLVVRNYALRATIRTRTPEAARVVQRVLRILENPMRAAAKDAHTSDLANAIVEDGRDLEPFSPRFYRPRKHKLVASVDAAFMKSMRFLAEDLRPDQFLRGTTVIYSRVYRVGSTDENKEMKARVLVGGDRPVELTIPESKVGRFFDAAKSQRMLPVQIDGCWLRAGEGEYVLDARRSSAMDVDTEWRPVSGVEFIEATAKFLPDAFENVDDILAKIQGR